MRIRQRLHLDAHGWYRESDAVPHLVAVAEALSRDQVIEIWSRRWAPRPGEVTRRLHTLGLVLKAGVWYLIAAGRGRPRTNRSRRSGRSRWCA
ncbi:WYL domain-containing protein [Paractinoplanes globisporus]|uniref:WYL domain-containing protein n=1 Tax=Paractinoplanes globisporus TaxID=113565 RepID=A0ABW6W6S2_9ACTN|nr:WYL domain-containing protein [Actinoplanes globisporus]